MTSNSVTPQSPHVLVHVVTFGHAATIERTLEALSQSAGVSLTVQVTDNCSRDDSFERITRFCERAQPHTFRARRLEHNIGFCGGQNSIIAPFLADRTFTHLCILNPDVAVNADCLATLVSASAAIATPKLLRGDGQLQAVQPRRLDATGMILTKSLRHFDRGSQELDQGQFDRPGDVFGGTGACLLLSRHAVELLLIPRITEDHLLSKIHPEIWLSEPGRLELFDEGFFAYREDAELAWRAQRRGISYRYVPTAVAIHKRSVLPEQRDEVSSFVNRLGVRNRFLLQQLHFSCAYRSALLPGFIWRNFIVLAAVLLKERSSLAAFRDLFLLRKRTARLREYHRRAATQSDKTVARWLSQDQE